MRVVFGILSLEVALFSMPQMIATCDNWVSQAWLPPFCTKSRSLCETVCFV